VIVLYGIIFCYQAIYLFTTTTLPSRIRATSCNAQIELNYITVATKEKKMETMYQVQDHTGLRLTPADVGGAIGTLGAAETGG
jgi:hypothetical protein